MGSSAEAPIDLTFDSDEESDPLQAASAPSKNPRKTPALTSFNLPRPSPSSAVRPQGTAASMSGFQLFSDQPRTSLPKPETNLPHARVYGIPPVPKTATSSKPLNGPDYVPVFASATTGGEADDFGIPQAEKRRRISGPPPGSEFYLPGASRRKSVPKQRFYGVRVGHVPGVYTEWSTAKAQIKGCKGAKQQSFDTREEAQAFVDGKPSPNPRFAPDHRRFVPDLHKRFIEGNGGAGPSPLRSPATIDANRADGKQTSLATHPNTSLHPVGGRPPPITKHSASGLPSVQFLNTMLRTNGATTPLAKPNQSSNPLRELHFGRIADATSSNRATKPASNGVAIGHSSADEMVIDHEDPLPHRHITFGQPHAEQGTCVEKAAEPKDGFTAGSSTVVEDLLDTLLEDDIVYELLQQLPANDKVALLMKSHRRGQQIARTMPQLPIKADSTQRPRGRPPLQDARSFPPASPSARDRIFSDSDTSISGDTVNTRNSVGDLSAARALVTTVEKPSTSKKWTGALSEAEAHLLIFLKEVKKLSWPEVTAKFQAYYPTRKYGSLQSNYSQHINRRDRSQDPTTLILPSKYASEAHINWAEVHVQPNIRSGHPGRKREAAVLQEDPKHRAWSAAVNSVQDLSSGAESTGHHKRPRRAVPIQNYTWPKRNAQIEGGSFEEDGVQPAEERFAVSETPKDLLPGPEKAIAVGNEPLSVDFDMDDAFSALAVQNRTAGLERLPYLSFSQRSGLYNLPRGFEWDQLISRDWQGALIHVDFSPLELDIVESTITRLLGPQRDLRSRSQRNRLRRLLHGVTEPKFLHLVGILRSKLHSRNRRSIDAFLRDAKEDQIRSTAPRIERLAASRPDKAFSSEAANLSTSSVIRKRELGFQSNRGWSSATPPISYQLKNKVQDTFGPVCSYTGASSDVHAVAWSVDGGCFAAAAICVDDPHSMQYNRSNNLLYGDVSRNTITELGKHYVERPRTHSGPNSTHAMYASQDPKLFKTVTSVAFSPDGKHMFSGGWDQNVWVWDTKYDGSQPTDAVSLHHKSEVSMMTVNASGVLATGTRKSTGNAVKVLRLCGDDLTQPPVTLNFSSERAAARPDLMILPMALHFSPRYENLLLGGFGANARQDGRDISGDICLWDINGNKQLNIWGSGKNVFDLSFHPRDRLMAVATVAGQKANRGMRSTVRLYREQGNAMDNKFSTLMELECRALDINDVVWCPGDDFLVAAGCTSGRAYVWDIRNSSHILHELAHGSSLMPLDDREDREVADTGIRFLSWGNNATRLYSGSSDGVVKVWNVAQSTEDTFVKDLITFDSGIMSGAFSPDYSRLLLGEVNGSVNVLEVGRDDCSLKDAEKMKYVPYVEDDPEHETRISTSKSAAADSGTASAKELLESGQMMIKPMGGLPIKQAVQGPSYSGPYDASVDAPFLRKQALEMQLKFPETSESPCAACLGPQSNPVKITSEDIGDSGRSMDRIPDALRSRWLAGTVNLKIPPAKVPCELCGRAARPRDRLDPRYGELLGPRCEHCDFTCLRCGCRAKVDRDITICTCLICGVEWDVGVLGYGNPRTHQKYSLRAGNPYDNVPELDGYKKDLQLAKLKTGLLPTGDGDASFGDDMNALTDYYFDLAIDRPE